ncbi:ATP-binding cassette domain-containing protein [Candidatus Enterococcus ferrettii]|uniref:ABC transporter domain-containing protein n=1 Tax=Candidatus Enterococcus ferrettii TaxID=2815324 RepID=A0ABV0EXY8_9ENTE|nr:ABC transporter ATP-binding protein [Enterococcus sp. 665A]
MNAAVTRARALFLQTVFITIFYLPATGLLQWFYGYFSHLPNGLKTPVGENGNNLSGGQRQRVAVARALIQNKPLLILDEFISRVDSKTAYDFETRLLNVPILTLLTITHNLSPELLTQYDEIIYMEEGKITARGSYEELQGDQHFASIKQKRQMQVAPV